LMPVVRYRSGRFRTSLSVPRPVHSQTTASFSSYRSSFDDPVCAQQHGLRDLDSKGARGACVYNQFHSARQLDREFIRPAAAQNTVRIAREPAESILQHGSVAEPEAILGA